jgi:BirA family biotin operon repressor/biotin-[acetyl-CoA-carboxylase] ligase
MNDLALTRGLKADFEAVSSVDSTQTALLARPASGLSHGQTMVAGHQTAGRGRLTRTWQDPEGQALLMSTVVHIANQDHHFEVLPLVAGLAVQRALHTVLSGVRLKWPNDIVMTTDDGYRKLGGIVASVHPQSQDEEHIIVVGIGLNISFANKQRPTELAAALADYVAILPTREYLAVAIVEQLHRALSEPLPEVMKAYRNVCSTLGLSVRVTTTSGETREGTAVSVLDDGSIKITTSDGDVAFVSGDVEHLRVT